MPCSSPLQSATRIVRRGLSPVAFRIRTASIITATDEKEAIAIANDTVFGLGSAVFTNDFRKGEQIAKTQLQVGCAFVNDFVKSDPRLPFGGIHQSGYGRELSAFGIYEFVNIKTVYIK